MATHSPANPAEARPPFPVHRLTVAQYHALGEAGVLGEDERVELLEGWIVPKMNLNPQHSVTVQSSGEVLRRQLPDGWCLRVQDAITTIDSQPEPDLAVVRGTQRDYAHAHPAAERTGLVVEVADSSLARDRAKRQIYARAGIPTYWIINLVDRRIEVYSDPTGPDSEPAYRRREDRAINDSVPLILDGQEVGRITVSELLD